MVTTSFIGEVLAIGKFAFRESARDQSCFGQPPLPETPRAIQTRGSPTACPHPAWLRPQHFRDDSLASLFRRRKRSISITTLSCGRALSRRIPYSDAVREHGPIHPDKGLATAFEGTHECAGGPFQNFYNLPRGVLGAGCIADDSKEHLITRGRVERLVLANEDFGLEEAVHGVRADKAVPGLGSAKDTAEGAPGLDVARRVLLRPKATRPERIVAHGLAELTVVHFTQIEA